MAAIMSVPPTDGTTGDEIALNFWTDNGHQSERERGNLADLQASRTTYRPLSPIRAFLGNHQACPWDYKACHMVA